ncbi:MAG: adenine deaminase [Polyangiaceae bacterium]
MKQADQPAASARVTQLQKRIAAARGSLPSDLVLQNARYLDVFSGAWVTADIAIYDGVIVGVEPGRTASRTVDLGGRAVVPGFIDAHVHVESSLLLPRDFEREVLPRGTTTAVCDPHELANVQGVAGIRYFLEQASNLSLDLRVMLSSCVPATTFETNGGGVVSASDLSPLKDHERALGLAEVMNVPAVLHGDPSMLDKLVAFDAHPKDGHCPLLRGADLSAYAVARITSCHESSELEEAREKLRKGIAVWIREGSVAKDLDALCPLLTPESSPFLGFCTDDRNPLDIAHEGHLDYLVRRAIAKGAHAPSVYRAVSHSVARHYGLAGSSVANPVGAIAPGYRADLVVLDDMMTCQIHAVYKSGVRTDELPFLSAGMAPPENSIRAAIPAESDLMGPTGMVHVIGVREGRILTDRHVLPHDHASVVRISVLERYGHGGKPANAYATGFGKLGGAIASSVGHDSHNLIVVGSNVRDMRAALAALAEMGGGFAVVRDGSVVASLPLAFGGLMSTEGPEAVVQGLTELRAASAAIGCELKEPFLQLAFLSLPVIPSLKLTDRGLMDVDKFELISVRAA